MIANFLSDGKNDAVAPVIGDILLIAIIIVIAGIIASHFMGMDDSLTEVYIIGTTAKQISADTIEIDFVGGKDEDKVLYLNVSVNGYYYNDSGGWYLSEQNTFGSDGTTPIEVGDRVTMNGSTENYITAGNNHVIIVGHFVDGTKQVVLDTNV